MKKLFVLSCIVVAASGAQAAELYLNGPVVNSNGLSILDTDSGATTLGVSSTAAQTLADNFSIVGTSWNVTSMDFFAYQTNSTSFTFTNVTWSLRSGTDVNTAATIASGTSAVTNGGLMGYRVTPTTLASTARGIYRINADIPDLVLGAGSYFVTFALTGTGASGPFVPPTLGSLGTGNALFATTGTFNPVIDTGATLSLDVPFAVQGSLVPEPGTYALMLAGMLGVVGAARRRASKVSKV